MPAITPTRDLPAITEGDDITLSDVPDQLLEKSYQAITGPTTGVKPHPDGWHEVQSDQ